MARYTVIWSPIAIQQLADAYLKAANPNDVTRASDEAERELARHAGQAGESRDDGLRVYFVSPLTIFFDVYEPDKTVEIVKLVLS
jgi:hypothetical protein